MATKRVLSRHPEVGQRLRHGIRTCRKVSSWTRVTRSANEHATATLKECPYGRWREYDPEDSVRVYSLRLHEAGMIKSSPQKIIADGTDWRFLNELKRELKA